MASCKKITIVILKVANNYWILTIFHCSKLNGINNNFDAAKLCRSRIQTEWNEDSLSLLRDVWGLSWNIQTAGRDAQGWRLKSPGGFFIHMFHGMAVMTWRLVFTGTVLRSQQMTSLYQLDFSLYLGSERKYPKSRHLGCRQTKKRRNAFFFATWRHSSEDINS